MLLDKKRTGGTRASRLALLSLTGGLGALILLFSQLPPMVVLGDERKELVEAGEDVPIAENPPATTGRERAQAVQAATSDQLLQHLLLALAQAEQQAAALAVDHAPGHPAMKRVAAFVQAIDRQVKERISAIEGRDRVLAQAEEVVRKRVERFGAADPFETEIQLLEQEIQLMEKIVQSVENQHKAGSAAERDLFRAQLDLLRLQREMAGLRQRVRPELIDIRPTRPEPVLSEEQAKQLVAEFVKMARDEDEPVRVRKTAIESLAQFGTEEIVRELKGLFEETPEADIQRAAFETLMRINTVPGTLVLLELYDQPTLPQVQIKGAIIQRLAMRVQILPEMRERIIEKLQVISKEEPDAHVRSSALRTLAGFARAAADPDR